MLVEAPTLDPSFCHTVNADADDTATHAATASMAADTRANFLNDLNLDSFLPAGPHRFRFLLRRSSFARWAPTRPPHVRSNVDLWRARRACPGGPLLRL